MGEAVAGTSFDLRREAQDDGGYDSTNEDDEEYRQRKKARFDLADKPKHDPRSKAKADKSVFRDEASAEEGRKLRQNFITMSAYDRHKQLVNTYQLYFRGSTQGLQRDTSRDKRDIDVIKEHHRFLWDEEGDEESWEVKLARRYYDKLFKEYCIVDLSRYKENKIGMRWRTEQEVVSGQGQFKCGAKRCEETDRLRTWEVNFAYVEQAKKRNALVKVRLCFDCSYKLNFHHKKKEVTRKKSKKAKKKRKKKKRRASSSSSSGDESSEDERTKKALEEVEGRREAARQEAEAEKQAADIWSAPAEKEEEKTRDSVFSEYLEDLFL